ncbi:MAG TPA: NAD-dependent epimerase/dehydratase family protein [Actinophytocola sp.]|jgi:UDP-glucose 4-epimerase|uniref:NAD-dependent epimerase/dehydratase family protein n=1 Tax=Actinophytocola sp. TaxID=1872138 RepID=UPI002E01AAB3|nr:NAD-dependent epimerase/dehydratase family protein [Actinophytocola sp.]
MTDQIPAADRPRTLITGGFGFIATWAAAGLLRFGHRVTLVDNGPVAGSPADLAGLPGLPDVTVGQADVTRPGALDHLGEFDCIVHAAALLGVSAVRRRPLEALRVNVDGTARVLEFAASNRALGRFLLLSTSEVYGNGVNVAEADWLSARTDDPRWSYAVSKTAAEALAYAYGAEHGLPFTVVRPFNVYGPLRTGSYAVGALGRQALAGGPITVHGSGRQSRAWCHVDDFVDGLIRCLRSPAAVGETFNLGDSRHHLTVAELAALIRDLTGGTAPIVHVPAPGPDIELRRPNLDKARDLLGYRPERGIEEGLRETVDWLAAAGVPYPVPLRRTSWPTPRAHLRTVPS